MRREEFMDFYSDFSDEDPEYIREYLESEGIDAEALRRKLSDEIRKRQVERDRSSKKKFRFSFDALRELGDRIGELFSPRREPRGATAGFTKDKAVPPHDDNDVSEGEDKPSDEGPGGATRR